MKLKFKRSKQRELLKSYKESNNFTWGQLAKLLKISKSKLKGLFREDSLISKKLYKILDKGGDYRKFIIEEREDNWGQRLGGKKSSGSLKQVRFPKKNKQLAEFFGILLGDGNINKFNKNGAGTYVVRIAGHADHDKEYLTNFVFNLSYQLFQIIPKMMKQKNKRALYVLIHSKKITEFLEEIGFPDGNKIKNKVTIPKWIYKNKEFLRVCLRGLFDTDGSIYRLTNQNLLQIKFRNNNLRLLRDVRKSLIELGINCSRLAKNNSVYITKKSEMANFFKQIGFKNSKHLNRIKMFENSPVV